MDATDLQIGQVDRRAEDSHSYWLVMLLISNTTSLDVQHHPGQSFRSLRCLGSAPSPWNVPPGEETHTLTRALRAERQRSESKYIFLAKCQGGAREDGSGSGRPSISAGNRISNHPDWLQRQPVNLQPAAPQTHLAAPAVHQGVKGHIPSSYCSVEGGGGKQLQLGGGDKGRRGGWRKKRRRKKMRRATERRRRRGGGRGGWGAELGITVILLQLHSEERERKKNTNLIFPWKSLRA